jgi:hypothetical protein
MQTRGRLLWKGNEHSGSKNEGNFFTSSVTISFSEGLCSMELDGEWTNLAQVKYQWWNLVNTVTKLQDT